MQWCQPCQRRVREVQQQRVAADLLLQQLDRPSELQQPRCSSQVRIVLLDTVCVCVEAAAAARQRSWENPEVVVLSSSPNHHPNPTLHVLQILSSTRRK